MTKIGIRIGAVIVIGLTSALTGCDLWSKEPEMYQGQIVYLSDDVVQIPFSLKEQGASLDVLARPDSRDKFLIAGLVAVRDSSWKYKDENWGRFFALIPDGTQYLKSDGTYGPNPKIRPFKLRIQIDSVEPDIGVHTDQTLVINSNRSMTLPKDHKTYWENLAPAGGLKADQAPPGIYRVRVTNLEARPDVDWIPMRIRIGSYRTTP